MLEWILERCAGKAEAVDSPIGRLPKTLNTAGLNVSAEALTALLSVDGPLWRKETSEVRAYLAQFAERLPQELLQELSRTEAGLA